MTELTITTELDILAETEADETVSQKNNERKSVIPVDKIKTVMPPHHHQILESWFGGQVIPTSSQSIRTENTSFKRSIENGKD